MILAAVFLGIVTALTVSAQTITECSTCILVNTTCYNISHILDLEAPFRKRVVIPKMGILRSKNTLFFGFEPVFEDEEYYKIGFVNLDDGSSGIISGGQILNLGTFDIDQDNNLIYFGGNDGIFMLDTQTNKMSSYSSRGDTIRNIFYKNKVYFSKYYERGIIVKNSDFFRTLYEDILVKNFVVTKYDVFVYLNNTGLYVSKGDVTHRISKNSFIRGLTMDLDGTVYGWWIDGLYKVDLHKNLEHSRFVRVAKLKHIGAMTFDNDNNIIFTSDRSLFIMKPTDNTECGIVKE